MIRVGYIGNFRHPHCTEVAVAAAFADAGCTVERIQQEHADPEQMRAGRFDLVVYTRTHNRTALDDRWTDLWRDLERHGTVTVSVHLDRFWDLERERLIHAHDPLFTTGWVFTADGGNHDRWLRAGVNHRWMPPAADARTVRRHIGPDPRFQHDIVFVGSGAGYHPEYPERQDLLAFLRRAYGRRFVHYGVGGRPPLRGLDLHRLYASARVVVGDSCFANRRPYGFADRYWSDRIPETLGRAGMLIHPYVSGMQPYFVDRVHLWLHDPQNWDELTEAIDSLLDAPQKRDRIRRAGRAHVLAAHTWSHRVAQILQTVGLPVEPGPGVEAVIA